MAHNDYTEIFFHNLIYRQRGLKDMEKIERKLITAEIDEIVKILNYYQDEWKFSQTHFWNLAIKMFTLNLIITILPFVSSVGGMVMVNQIPPYVFLIAAIIISLTELFILLAEGIRHIDIGEARMRINNMLPSSYRYYENEKKKSRKASTTNWYRKYLRQTSICPSLCLGLCFCSRCCLNLL
jgi:hypothetical protein